MEAETFQFLEPWETEELYHRRVSVSTTEQRSLYVGGMQTSFRTLTFNTLPQ